MVCSLKTLVQLSAVAVATDALLLSSTSTPAVTGAQQAVSTSQSVNADDNRDTVQGAVHATVSTPPAPMMTNTTDGNGNATTPAAVTVTPVDPNRPLKNATKGQLLAHGVAACGGAIFAACQVANFLNYDRFSGGTRYHQDLDNADRAENGFVHHGFPREDPRLQNFGDADILPHAGMAAGFVGGAAVALHQGQMVGNEIMHRTGAYDKINGAKEKVNEVYEACTLENCRAGLAGLRRRVANFAGNMNAVGEKEE